MIIKQIIVTGTASGCLLMVGAGIASANAGAYGTSSGVPDRLSGALAQAPATAATDVCGATLHAVGLLHPLLGDLCGATGQGPTDRSATDTTGTARHSPGTASGNVVQLPLQASVNACGDTVNILGLLNPAGANGCRNHLRTPRRPSSPPVRTPTPPPVEAQSPPPPQPAAAHLADTGADGLPIEAPAAVALLSLGALCYRRGRRLLPQ